MENEKEIKSYLLKRMGKIMKQPLGRLKYPFFDPGMDYAGEQWDWDSCFEGQALYGAFDIFSETELAGYGITREKVAEHGKGSVLNFLEAQEEDGYIPILVCEGGIFEGYFKKEHENNQCVNPGKLICLAACNACRFTGDYTWLDVDKLIAYLGYFEKNLYHEATGLFFFQDDIMVGIDNNPTVFYRNPRSCADIYLNSIMYVEYCSASEILKMTGDGRAEEIADKAAKLKDAVNREMWDEHDGIFYSQDLTRYEAEKKVKDMKFHSGLGPSWNSTPLKIRFWACFLPMWAGLCPADRAERMCKHLEINDDIFAAYGIRTCARNEKMYNLEKSSNPSNWLGAVWTVANVLIWIGLKRHGHVELAEKLKNATISLLGNSVKNYGDTFESYHPDTGEPMLHPEFLSFNLLVFEMMK